MTDTIEPENIEHLILNVLGKIKTIALKQSHYDNSGKPFQLHTYDRDEQIALLDMGRKKYERDLYDYNNGRVRGD